MKTHEKLAPGVEIVERVRLYEAREHAIPWKAAVSFTTCCTRRTVMQCDVLPRTPFHVQHGRQGPYGSISAGRFEYGYVRQQFVARIFGRLDAAHNSGQDRRELVSRMIREKVIGGHSSVLLRQGD
jgi:hypothetical protein